MPPISHMSPMSVTTTASEPSRLRSAMTPATTKRIPITPRMARSLPSRAVAVIACTIRTTPCNSSQMPNRAAITFNVASGQAIIMTPRTTLVTAPASASHQPARTTESRARASSAAEVPAGVTGGPGGTESDG
jgi:hypothetical protein